MQRHAKKKRLEWHGWKEFPCKCAQALRFMLTSTIQCLHRKWGWVCCWCGPAVSISFARALRLRYKNWWGRLGQGRVGAWKLSFKLGQTPAAVPQRGWIGLGRGVEPQSCADWFAKMLHWQISNNRPESNKERGIKQFAVHFGGRSFHYVRWIFLQESVLTLWKQPTKN